MRFFRELESPVPVDLVVVRGFDGMAGMDGSGASLGAAAARAGTSVGALYGRIASYTSGHTDEFVQLRPEWVGAGDPMAPRITAFIRLRAAPGERAALERALETVARFDAERGVPSAAGRLLLAEGWDVLRWVGFEDLGAVEAYLTALDGSRTGRVLAQVTAARSVALLGTIEEFSIR